MKNLINKVNLYWLVLIVAIYLVLNTLMIMGVINSVLRLTLINIGINTILAISLNLIIGVCGQFTLGHAGFMCVGAYSSAIITRMMPNYFGLAIGIVVGMIISSVLALIVAVPTLRLKGDYLAIATLGFAEIIRIVVNNLEITNGAAGLSGIPKLTNFSIVYFSIVVSIILIANFAHSAPGRACISVREDEIASESMGINTTKYKIIAFIIGAAVASYAGSLFASNLPFIKPTTFGFAKSIDILVIVVFGGLGSVTGSIISSLLLGLISLSLQSFAEIRMIIYALAIIAIMIFRPTGLLGNAEFTVSRIVKWIKKRQVKNNVTT